MAKSISLLRPRPSLESTTATAMLEAACIMYSATRLRGLLPGTNAAVLQNWFVRLGSYDKSISVDVMVGMPL